MAEVVILLRNYSLLASGSEMTPSQVGTIAKKREGLVFCLVRSPPWSWTNPAYSIKCSVHFCTISLREGHLCLHKCVDTAFSLLLISKKIFQQLHLVFKITTRQPQFTHPHGQELLLRSLLLHVSSTCTEMVRVEMLTASRLVFPYSKEDLFKNWDRLLSGQFMGDQTNISLHLFTWSMSECYSTFLPHMILS